MTDDGGTVLLVSNRRLDEPVGRAEKLATYRDLLAERGWQIEVLYVRHPASLLASVVRGVWRARTTDADVVHSVNNPFHLHLIGYLVSMLSRRPWVAELRDALTTDPDLDSGSLRGRLRGVVEWLVATRSRRLMWADGIQLEPDYFEDTYGVPGDRVTKLSFSGYVVDEFEDASTAEYDEFTVTYAGSFYDGWIEPYRFLDGLAAHVTERGSDDVRVQFYGDWSEDYQRVVEESGLADVVSHHDFVPHDQIVPVLKGSDALLYVGGDDPANRQNVPSKIWDYIGARSPILAIVDPSFRVAEFVEGYDAGIVVDPDDTDGIASALSRLRTGAYEYDPDPALFEFTREGRIDELARVYGSIVQE